MELYTCIQLELFEKRNSEQAKNLARFFKTGKGEYGEGDIFLGVKVPEIRKIIRPYIARVTMQDISGLLQSSIHEHRFAGVILLVKIYRQAQKVNDMEEQTRIAQFYLHSTKYINNWDLVDVSASHILGSWWYETSQFEAPMKLAVSGNLWEQRISVISTFFYIKKKRYQESLGIAQILLFHTHDLIHKAVGWILREIGKQDQKVLEDFLKLHAHNMPRTMLRYSLEKLPPDKRNIYLSQ